MLMDAQSTYAGSFPGQPRRANGADAGYDSQGLASLITEKLNGYDGYPYGYSSSSATIPESTTLPPSQSLPTSVLYERARQAAVAKSSAHARREGLQSTRRPWTPEEEKALMAGLDMVKGPHWSQILQLFGLNGTISDILKDRTQVQLKDKARNLKLFFLKTNSEMPYYLQCVTGELKTRAPSQAARKEAEEQARVQAGSSPGTYASTYMNGSTVNGTSSLAHGLPASGSPRPGSATPGAGPSTPGGASQAHYQPPSTYQQHSASQQSHSYQQHRPQQLQPAPNNSTASQPRPLQPQSQHQPIAPAPSYQRTLQQAGSAATPQYQARPVQQQAVQTPTNYQQMQQQGQRPAPVAAGSTVPPRPGSASTVIGQSQPRPMATVGQQASTAPRPMSAAAPGPARQTSTPSASTTPLGAAAAHKGVPIVMPAPPSQAPANPTPAAPRPSPHPPAPGQALPSGSQPTASTGAMRPVQSVPSPSVAVSAKPASPATAPIAKNTPAPAAVPAPAPPPALTPAPAHAPAPIADPPASTHVSTVESAESKEKAADELLAQTLKAALDSA